MTHDFRIGRKMSLRRFHRPSPWLLALTAIYLAGNWTPPPSIYC